MCGCWRDLVTGGMAERNHLGQQGHRRAQGDRPAGSLGRTSVIAEAPDWLSIKIGINDLHNYLWDKQNGVSPTRFRDTYRAILTPHPREDEGAGHS